MIFNAYSVRALVCALFASATVSYGADPIVTESTSTVRTDGNMTTKVESPPPSAISPQISGGSNSDLCTVGVAGAVQTQILGISMGKTTRDMNCEKLKNAKTLYDMGMKVAAVSVMCQDERVFEAMSNAGTPCPYKGLIGEEAQAAWDADAVAQPDEEAPVEDKKRLGLGAISGVLGLLFLF